MLRNHGIINLVYMVRTTLALEETLDRNEETPTDLAEFVDSVTVEDISDTPLSRSTCFPR